MKRMFDGKTYAAVVAVMCGLLVFGGCKGKQNANNAPAPAAEETVEAEPVVEVVQDGRPRVYSNAYDGYVNIREQPNSKAAILGRLNNGPTGAVVLGEDNGKWVKVECKGIEGYVSKSYVQDTPTKTADLSADWVVGEWWGDDSYITFDANGTFVCGNGYAGFGEGKWRIEEKTVVLQMKSYMDEPSNETKILAGNVEKDTLGDYWKDTWNKTEDFIPLKEIPSSLDWIFGSWSMKDHDGFFAAEVGRDGYIRLTTNIPMDAYDDPADWKYNSDSSTWPKIRFTIGKSHNTNMHKVFTALHFERSLSSFGGKYEYCYYDELYVDEDEKVLSFVTSADFYDYLNNLSKRKL